MYTKNLEHLLRLLQSSRQSGLLSVEQDGALWQGLFRLVEGRVMACQVCRKATGQVLLSNDEAMRWLLAQGRLNWSVQESAHFPDTLLPSLPPPGGTTRGEQNTGKHKAISRALSEQAEWIPRRTWKGMHTSAQSLEPFERLQVFTLVNGNNTFEGITRILRKIPPDIIMRILNDLRGAGLIE